MTISDQSSLVTNVRDETFEEIDVTISSAAIQANYSVWKPVNPCAIRASGSLSD